MLKYKILVGIILSEVLLSCHSDQAPKKQSETTAIEKKNVEILKRDPEKVIKDSDRILRLGWSNHGYDTNGIFVYEKIKKDLQYHVFSKSGREVYSSSTFKMMESEGCSSDDVRTTWFLLPETIYDTAEFRALNDHMKPPSYWFPLVVGTKVKTKFAPPTIFPVSDEQKVTSLKILGISDSGQIESIRFIGAGTKGDTSRILVEIPNQEIPKQGSPDEKIPGWTIAIIDLEGNRSKLIYKNTTPGNEGVAFCGLADLDEDGLCESFSVDSGDFGGKWLLSEKNGKWEASRDGFEPGPC